MFTAFKKPDTSDTRTYTSYYAPMRVIEIELGQPLLAITSLDEKTQRSYQRALCLVRLHTQPLGQVEIPLLKDVMQADEYVEHIWSALRIQILEHLQQDGLPPVSKLDAMGLSSTSTPRCIEEHQKLLA